MCKKVIVTGISNSPEAMITYYEYPIDTLIFKDIYLSNITLLITFDNDATKSILGMDVLSKLNMYHAAAAEHNEEILLLSDNNKAILDYVTKLEGGL